MSNLKQSETVFVKRSLISFAPYNPRKEDKKIVEKLKRNFKKVGFLGGIQWNETTGNLIGGHKRLMALDLVHGYDGTPETDYEVKVEKIAIDLKTEKEQNIFLNSKSAQGQTDYNLLAELIETIDIEAASIDPYEMEIIEAYKPSAIVASNKSIKMDMDEMLDDKRGVNHVKSVKEKMKANFSGQQSSFYFSVVFSNYTEKAEFLESIGINGDDTQISGKTFIQKLSEA